MGRLFLALKFFFRILGDGELAEKLRALDREAPEPEQEEEPFNPQTVQLLSLFQREGRLVDFLMEDIQDFDDAQIGAAVRSVHRGCKKVLDEYLELAPVMKEQEGSIVTVQKGYDASAMTLSGEVAGEAPYRGELAHHGWKAERTSLPDIPEGQNSAIIAAAEVEVK